MQTHTDLRVLEVKSDNSKRTPRNQTGSVEQLWDVSEAAKFLRIHPKTLRDKASSNAFSRSSFSCIGLIKQPPLCKILSRLFPVDFMPHAHCGRWCCPARHAQVW